MCTALYIPDSKGNYIFSTSRDEHKDRPVAENPNWHQSHGKDLFFPRDPAGGGSWIVCLAAKSLCILNGAFEPHERRPPYRMSRGQIPIEYSTFQSTSDFLDRFDFLGIEPFTFLIADGYSVEEIRWDGNMSHYCNYGNDQPKLWASAPLYNREMVRMRLEWFQMFLNNNPNPDIIDVLNFYLHGGNGNPHNGLMIQRENGVETSSISCIQKFKDELKFLYRTEDSLKVYDLVSN
ncbi:MAG: hypothetical protein EA409_08580 [Saprospirales bacterium]|nr:MAG: hypothetical protein EA409_08580 [Saprospirales bacterium]